MGNALTEFFFKYRPVVFQKGHIVFGLGPGATLTILLIAAAGLVAVATYTRVRVQNPRDRIIFGSIRTCILLLLVFALLHPVLVVAAAISQRNVVGVVIDDSRSMQVADMSAGGNANHTRADVVRSLLGGGDSALYKALSKDFIVRLFRLSDGNAVTTLGDLHFDGNRTQIAPALEGVRQELTGVPLAGLVLASDGVDNTPRGLDDELLSLNARHIPVFTVGIGQERFAKDIDITSIDAPRTVLKGATIILNVDITQRGFGGQTVPVVVEDSGRIVSTENVILPKDGEATTLRIRAPSTAAGARLFTVRIAPQPGELIRENNAQTALITVQNQRDKILYIEGEPRFELKYIRQAVEDDDNLQLVTVVRTAKDKFLRMGVDNPNELADGFPQTREELFQYKAIILGSIEASYFTFDQLRMISDFVSERGGGLLMLGGRTSFAEGGYAGTPVADALPVELAIDQRGKPAFHPIKVSITPVGAVTALTQIGANEAESARKWQGMPLVTSMNRITRIKPGAVTLLQGNAPKGGDPTIVLARQRYGRGTSMAFSIQDSWMWQMRPDTRADDPTYHNFWRQTLRWLVNDVPGRVTVAPSTDRAWINEPLQLDATVDDANYHTVANAAVNAIIQSPSGATAVQPVAASANGDGTYHLSYIPREQGTYRITVNARSADSTVTSAPAFVDVGTPTSEYTGAELRTSLLQRVAEETGGRYYTAATAPELAKDLVYTGGGNTSIERLDLWDMPIVLILLLGALAAEWGYRRVRGLI